MKLNARQKSFCEFYVASGNATEAATKAGYSETYSKTRTNVLLQNVEICRYINELQEKTKTSRIMTAIERKEFLTKMILKEETKDTDRLKALDILNKMDGEYIQKLEVKGELKSEDPFKGLSTDELKKVIFGGDK